MNSATITLAAAKRHLALAGWVIKPAGDRFRVYPQFHGACDYFGDSIVAAVAVAENKIAEWQAVSDKVRAAAEARKNNS